ncbi:MAG: Rieske (2Fe-2S) protein [Parasphingorhabdus sp.]|uniref:Rieske (2Fe-2S) protein n=1 Tax=Parasphingorhabdus sp. TaxID=2709688 RepID=UPI003298F29D
MRQDRDNTRFAERSNHVDYDAIAQLHYLGNYVRKLPVKMPRMIENAYDWEHLPFVHQTSFSNIALIDSGAWGWRAKVGLPPEHSDNYQILELLVDASQNYWATTVLEGQGAGIEIHTQASEISADDIEVDVQFYLPQAPEPAVQSDMILGFMQNQYRQLYDEDLGLMEGRQSALDRKKCESSDAHAESEKFVAARADMDREHSYIVIFSGHRFVVRYWQDQWIAHSAICPHLLGPLEEATIDAKGQIRCPWHGYRFDVQSGKNIGEQCGSLKAAPQIMERDGNIYLARSA